MLLTVEEHAEAHRVLFEQFGRQEDFIAWRGLAGMITRDELIHELQVLAGKKAVARNQPWKNNKTATNWAINPTIQKRAENAAHSEEASKKRKETYKEIGHQSGAKNSNYGKSVYRNESGDKKRFTRGTQPQGWILSSEWNENKKDKKNNTYGKKWYNDGMVSFLLSPSDDRTKNLKLGRLCPGF